MNFGEMHSRRGKILLMDEFCWASRYKGRSILWKGRTRFESVVAICVHTSPFQKLSVHCTLIHSLYKTQYFWKGNIFGLAKKNEIKHCLNKYNLTYIWNNSFWNILECGKNWRSKSHWQQQFSNNTLIQRSQNSSRKTQFFQWIAFLPLNKYTRGTAQHTF